MAFIYFLLNKNILKKKGISMDENQPSITFEAEVKQVIPNKVIKQVPIAKELSSEEKIAQLQAELSLLKEAKEATEPLKEASKVESSVSIQEDKKLFWERLDDRTQAKLKYFSKSSKKGEKQTLESLIDFAHKQLKANKIESKDLNLDLSEKTLDQLKEIASIKNISTMEVVKGLLDEKVSNKSVDTFMKHKKV